MNSLLQPFLQTILLLGIVCCPPIHGISQAQVIWLLAIGVLWFVVAMRESGRTPIGAVFVWLLIWPLWPSICTWSWFASDLIHRATVFFVELSGAPIGVGPTTMRIDGIVVTADPMKTASLALLLFLFVRLGRTVVRSGIRLAAADSLVLIPMFFCFALMRWFVVAPSLAAINPDLVSWGDPLFHGPLLALSLFPLALLPYPESPSATRMGTRPFIAWTLVLFLLIIGQALPGLQATPAPGILIDESHSLWEPLLPPVSVISHPILAENNFRPFLHRLLVSASVTVSLGGDHTVHDLPQGLRTTSWEALMTSRESLEKYKVILLKCPTRPFEKDDQNRIYQWVEHGGILLVLGEHTDVFFINSHLNELLASSGMRLNADGICDGQGRWLVTAGPLHSPLPWAPGTSRYMWATGASIDGPANVLPLMVSSPDAFSDPAIRSNHHFFGTLSPNLQTRYGPFLLAAALPVGKGLIIAHGDSTNFNAAMISTPGKSAFIHRLLRAASFPADAAPLALVILLISGILGCQALGSLLRSNSIGLGILAVLLQLGFVLDLPGIWMQMNRPSGASVLLDQSLSPRLGLSYGHQSQVTGADSLVPLIAALENLGFPGSTSLSELHVSLKSAPGLVILAEPQESPSIKSLRALKHFIRTGGTCLLCCPKSLEGASRVLALGLGLAEFPAADPQTGLPTVSSDLARSHLLTRDLGFTRFPLGSGSLFLLENCENSRVIDFPRIAGLLADPLLRR